MYRRRKDKYKTSMIGNYYQKTTKSTKTKS